MGSNSTVAALALAGVLAFAACADTPTGPDPQPQLSTVTDACWGQATKVFAQTGEMGEHASQQPTPRLGLRNLARLLFDAGVIPEDSMAALGAFVAAELGLSIEACM